jgi:serine/threonine-protein kinase
MSDTGSKTSPDFSTEVQSWLGTPRYMAPEQITLGRNVDERADIWAIGTLLYELVAGHPPFQDKSLDVLCKRVLEEPPSALAEESAEPLPRGLDAVVARCLEKSPEARYQTVGILARALGPFASTSHAETVARIGALPGMAPSEGESAMASSPVLSSARRRGAWLGVLGAAIAIGAGAVMLAGPASPSRASQGPRRAGESASAMVETAPDPIAKPAASLSSAPSSSPSEAPPRRGAVHRYPRPTPAPTVKHPEFGGRL